MAPIIPGDPAPSFSLRTFMASTHAAAMPAEFLRTRIPEWVVFTCSGQRFAFSLNRVREILRPRAATQLPGCGPEVIGLAGLRGRILTVFDLGVVLGAAAVRRDSDYRLLLIEHDERLFAGAVDEVVAVARTNVEPIAGTVGAPLEKVHEAGLVIGAGEWGADPFVALDSDRLLEGLLV